MKVTGWVAAKYRCDNNLLRFARGILYMAALTAYRCNPIIRRFAEHLQEQGKAFKVVITACMRKLLIILNTMIRNQTLWSLEKL